MMRFLDNAKLGEIRKLDNGSRVAEVPVARTGIQDYLGREVGRPDMPVVRMYRPPEAVFADSYLRSMAHKPVTDDHPRDSVTSANWKEHAAGWTGETIRKDEAAGLIYVPMLFADQAVIDKLENGKREVSCGYECEVEWTAGVTDAGEEYDAIQRPTVLNHIALVSRGRAGSTCRVGDDWQPINKEPLVATKTITFDGLPVEVTDAAEAVINKLTGQLAARDTAVADAERKEGAAVAALDAEKGKVAALEAQLADAKVTPEKLERMVADRAALVDQAKAIVADFDAKGLDDAAIRKAVVVKKLGDKAPTSDAAIEGAFAVLAAAVDAADPVRDAVRGAPEVVSDGQKAADSAYAKFCQSLEDGYKTKVQA